MKKPRVKESNHKEVVHRLHVKGVLWCGSKCNHEYPLRVTGAPELDGIIPKDYDHVKRIAGDFSEVHEAKLVTTEKWVTEKVTEVQIAM